MSDKPLWMPTGSIRGLIALGLVVATVGLAIMGKESESIKVLTGMALGYYFGTRDSEAKPGA